MYQYSKHIWINGKGEPGASGPERYEHVVKHYLDQIHHSRTGRAVMTEINRRAKKWMEIVPLDGVFNAEAGATNPQHATRWGYSERSGKNGQLVHDSKGKTISGDGEGSNVVVKFTASTWLKYCKTGKKGHKSGARPDEVLFHEMVHGAREMMGVFDPEPLEHLYDTTEEFYAILIANIYASEKGRKIDLRADHSISFTPLSHNLDTSAKFLPKIDWTNYRYTLIDDFVREETNLAQALRHINTSFNPIRRYYELNHHHHHAKNP